MTAPVRREPVGNCQHPGDAAQAVQQGEQVAATVGGAGGSAHRGIAMQQAYRRSCKAAAVAFMLVTLYTVPTKLLQGRLGHDWAHSVLHLGSPCWLLTPAGWPQRRTRACRHVGGRRRLLRAWSYGLFMSGLLLGTPLAIPLGVPENLLHLLLSVPALAVVLLQLRSAGWHVPEGDRPRPPLILVALARPRRVTIVGLNEHRSG
jgi:hypothetical protein